MRSVRLRSPEKARARRLWVRIWVPLIVLGSVLLTFALGAVARTDVTCRVCHSMRPYSWALATGEHALLTCAECHASAGIGGMFADGVAMHRRIVSNILGADVAATSSQTDAGCRACHPNVLEGTLEADGIAVRHADFANVHCGQCHGGTGHRLEARVYAAQRMDDCLACHRTSAVDPEGCGLCHLSSQVTGNDANTVWGVMHGPNWSQTHGAGEITTCGSCHPRDYCIDCHGVMLPHPEGWGRTHGGQVLDEGQEPCRSCHDDAWCSACHGEPMPHGDGFATRHAEVATDPTDARCTRCHDAADCEACHLNAHIELPEVGTPHQRQMDR